MIGAFQINDATAVNSSFLIKFTSVKIYVNSPF